MNTSNNTASSVESAIVALTDDWIVGSAENSSVFPDDAAELDKRLIALFKSYAPAFEYRVAWRRKDGVQQIKRYANERGAMLRYVLLTSATPWKYLGKSATDLVCCGGSPECSCDGETYQAMTERIAKESPLEYVRFERRAVGGWKKYEAIGSTSAA